MGIEVITAFLLANWQYIIILILVIDKIVALTSTKIDDLIWTAIKKVLFVFVPSKNEVKEEDKPKE